MNKKSTVNNFGYDFPVQNTLETAGVFNGAFKTIIPSKWLNKIFCSKNYVSLYKL